MNYSFTIIEDGQVPLAGDFSSFNFLPVVLVIAAVFIIIAMGVYISWISSHLHRIEFLSGENLTIKEYLFHPIGLMRYEYEVEHEVIMSSKRKFA